MKKTADRDLKRLTDRKVCLDPCLWSGHARVRTGRLNTFAPFVKALNGSQVINAYDTDPCIRIELCYEAKITLKCIQKVIIVKMGTTY